MGRDLSQASDKTLVNDDFIKQEKDVKLNKEEELQEMAPSPRRVPVLVDLTDD